MNSFKLISIDSDSIEVCYNNKYNIICKPGIHGYFKYHLENFDFDVYREFVPLKENQYKLSERCELRIEHNSLNNPNKITGFKFILIDSKNGHYNTYAFKLENIIIENNNIRTRDINIHNHEQFTTQGIIINDKEIFNELKSTPSHILTKICHHFIEFDNQYHTHRILTFDNRKYLIICGNENIEVDI